MTIFVEFDEQSFQITGQTRHHQFAGGGRRKIGEEQTCGSPLSEEASSRGRSSAHAKRYAESSRKPA